MSYEAIHAVTKGLQVLLHSQLLTIHDPIAVTLLAPGDALPQVLGVNLYLYRVVESPFTKNQPWRGDRTTPPTDTPALALQLHYLLTPLAPRPDDTALDGDSAHQTLGLAMLTLHEHPILNDVHLPGFDADTELPSYVLDSYERVKITHSPVSVEELSRIWSTINQPYRLSVAYEVSLVEVLPTVPAPSGGGIVLSTGVNVVTLDAPRLTGLAPATGALAHLAGGVVTTNELRITGFGFSFPGQQPSVLVGGQPAAIKTTPAPTDQALTVTLPVTLDAGPQVDVRVRLNRRTSTPLSFRVSPWLSRMTPIRTALDTAPSTLVLTGEGLDSPQAVRFEGPSATVSVTTFAPGGSSTQVSVSIPVGLANGIHNVRLVLADASASLSNSQPLEVIPRVDTPLAVATVSAGGTDVHQLTLNGARLDGTDVRLRIDGVMYQTGKNSTATTLQYTLGRKLDAGTHTVSVSIDGHTSHDVTVEV